MYSSVIPGKDKTINVTLDKNEFTFLFNDKDNEKYLQFGWSAVENIGTWTNQKSSILFLDFEQHSDYYLDLTMASLPDPDAIQEVEIFLNGDGIGKFKLENLELTNYTVAIPAELLVEDYNILEFRPKFLRSPMQLGINDDSRKLAVYFSKLKFYK